MPVFTVLCTEGTSVLDGPESQIYGVLQRGNWFTVKWGFFSGEVGNRQ